MVRKDLGVSNDELNGATAQKSVSHRSDKNSSPKFVYGRQNIIENDPSKTISLIAREIKGTVFYPGR